MHFANIIDRKMNNLETAIPFMQQLKESLDRRGADINKRLSKVNIKEVSFDAPVEKVQAQIKSAETKYTIAFVGTFSTGKSTIINSLLELKGDARLSSESDPDTAECIRIMKKPNRQNYDAEIIFEDQTCQKVSWQEARQYTSQVARDKRGTEFKEGIKEIDEVRYYIDHPFLEICNILDLPGTGAGGHIKHEKIAKKKIPEADCVFWIVSTDAEPDKSSIANLSEFHTKMLPIINVWQCEKKDIYSTLSPDGIREMLESQFHGYFASAEKPIYYYAREIDLAQEEGRELKDEWGKIEFVEKVQQILSNIHSGDRMTRIRNNLGVALETYKKTLKELLEDNQLVSLGRAEKGEKEEIRQIREKLQNAKRVASGKIRSQSKASTQEILDIFSDASDAFISNTMQGMSLEALFQKKRFEEKLKRDFENNYVKIKSGWLDKNVKEFSDETIIILQGVYSDFSMDFDTAASDSNEFSMKGDDLSGFIDDMAQIINKDMAQRIAPAVISAIGGGILILIPGGLILEALGTILASGIAAATGIGKDDKLRSRIVGVQSAAKVQIRQQRAKIAGDFSEQAEEANRQFYDHINEEIQKRSDDNEIKISELRELEFSIRDAIEYVSEQADVMTDVLEKDFKKG